MKMTERKCYNCLRKTNVVLPMYESGMLCLDCIIELMLNSIEEWDHTEDESVSNKLFFILEMIMKESTNLSPDEKLLINGKLSYTFVRKLVEKKSDNSI